jgi:transportin-1
VYEQGSEFFSPLVQQLLENCVHTNKKVQEASCSAVATLEEAAGVHIIPFLPAILTTIVSCFGLYQQRNMLVLYDCIGTLAEVAGAELNKPEYISVLIPPLLQRWQSLPDQHKDLLPLFECLASVVIALGMYLD